MYGLALCMMAWHSCVLHCVAMCCIVLQWVAVWCSVVQCVAVCYSMLQCVTVCCSVLQCAVVWYTCFYDYAWSIDYVGCSHQWTCMWLCVWGSVRDEKNAIGVDGEGRDVGGWGRDPRKLKDFYTTIKKSHERNRCRRGRAPRDGNLHLIIYKIQNCIW